MAKGFVVAHEAWYRTAGGGVFPKDKPYEINIGNYTDDDSVTPQGEFCLVWHQLQSPKHPPAMRIEMFEDSMAWLAAAPDLFRELAALHGKNPQPAKIIEILTRLGYEDVTKRENPDDITRVARSIADSAKRGHDREKYDQDTDRVLNDSRDALLSVEDVARAYLDGKTVLYRPVGSGAGEWIVARGTHNIEFDKYEYRVKPMEEEVCETDVFLCNRLMQIVHIEESVSKGLVDHAVVERFNGLVKEGKVDIQCDGHLGKTWVPFEEDILYRLRKLSAPKPEIKMTTIPQDYMRGIYNKYRVTKADGSPTDPKAEYFVLRLDEDNPWGHACREAVLCLARNLRDEFPQLTHDLITRYGGKAADTMVIRGPARDAHFDELEVSIARGRIRAGECDKEVSERYEKIWIEDDKVTPLNLCIAEQVVKKGFCDGVVVARFLRLMDEGRLETRSPLEIDAPWVTLDIGYYGARPPIRIKDQNASPAPRYRPFDICDEFKLSDFCGKKVRAISDDLVFTIQAIGFDRMYVDGVTYTWRQMFGTFVWADTREPFGVKL